MVSLPRKGETGQNFKKWAVDSINRLIDYLTEGAYLRNGNGISIEHTASGILIGLDKQNNSVTPQVLGKNEGATGIESAVSGGTASVFVSGSSPLVIEPANGNIFISGGTNGELKIGASATTGMPDFSNLSPEYISLFDGQGVTKSYPYAVWLIGYAGSDTASDMSSTITLSIGSKNFYLLDLGIGSTSLYGYKIPVLFPVPANTTFSLHVSGVGAALALYVYPSI